MIVGVPKETYPGERRVALVPAVIATMVKAKLEVLIEKGAGVEAGFLDDSYGEQGAKVVGERRDLFSWADVIVQVRGLGANPEAGSSDLDLMRPGQVIIGLLDPLGNPEAARELSAKEVTAFALELVPRISRAQSIDVLSSMATIAGYKAVLLAASSLPKMYPMMMTAAGTITPAKVFVVGAGVAGLQAIATARRLGAVVQAYDVRPAVKDQVQSLGAKFIELEMETETAEGAGGYAKAMDEDFYRRQRELMTKVLAESDVVITTAAVPGKKSPVLVTKEMVGAMRHGSVIVDLAAEGGGNCELTKPGEEVISDGVTILGPLNLPSTIPYHASQMYARNLTSFLQNLVKDGEVNLSLEDQIVKESLLTHQGEVTNARVRDLLGLPASATSEAGSPSNEGGGS